MSRILAHVLRQPRWVGGAFYDYGDFFERDSNPIQATYVQGYGALYFVEVNFPLTPPPGPEQQQESADAEGDADPIWRQAELGTLPSTSRQINIMPLNYGRTYHPDKIEQLKTDLTKALRHASNIRNMAAEEWVIVSVTGADHDSPAARYSTYGNLPGGARTYGYYRDVASAARELAPDGPTINYRSFSVLTLRAKKSDIDAFAKGELDYDGFSQRVHSSVTDIPMAGGLAQAAVTDAKEEPRVLVLSVDRSGQVHVDGAPADRATCLDRIKAAKKNNYAVRIEADEAAGYRNVDGIVNLCKGAGITEVILLTRKDPAAAQTPEGTESGYGLASEGPSR
jgi:biopolymer transport protein ExbD